MSDLLATANQSRGRVMSQPDLEIREPVQRSDGIWAFDRQTFVRTRFDYEPGEHVVFGGPTQRGKTTLAFELLEWCATPDCPAYVAVSKPRDPTTEQWGKKLNYVRVKEWPASVRVKDMMNGNRKPPGFLVWPDFGNLDLDSEKAAKITRALLQDRYRAGVKHKKGILVMDDTMTKSKLMGLDKEMTTILAMAGAMDIGMWTFVQKPTDSGRTAIWSYSQSEHIFLAYDPDAASRKRYDEIGGFDPKIVSEATRKLKPYEFLYMKRTGQHLCIVGAK